MPRLIILILSLVLYVCANAQRSSVYITAEAGWSDDRYKMDDPGNRFGVPAPGSGLFGITVRKMISSYVFLETGLYTREYHEGLTPLNGLSYSGSGRRTVQLPLRIGGRWGFIRDRIVLRPAAGLAFNVADNYERGRSWGTLTYAGEVIDYSYQTAYQTQAFFLLQGGLSAEYRVGKRIYLGMASSWSQGLEKIQLQRIEYSVNGGPTITAIASTRGAYHSITGSFTYRFGK